jgi:hypothetical protein
MDVKDVSGATKGAVEVCATGRDGLHAVCGVQ